MKQFGALFLGLTLLVFSHLSCKNPTLTGSDLLVEDDKVDVFFTDKLTLISTTVIEDSLRTDGNSELLTYLLGRIDDYPVFGKSIAGIFTQVKLPTNSVDLGPVLGLDSVVLTLTYAGAYGDITVPQSVVVYQVTEDMDPDAVYQSDRQFQFAPVELGRKDNFKPDLVAPVTVLGDVLVPHLRIRLHDSFGTHLLNQSGTANFENNNAFLDFFKGIYISPDTNNISRSIVYYDLNSAISRLTIYYNKGDDSTYTFNLKINGSGAKVNYFKHDYTRTMVGNALTGATDSFVYVQSMAGVKARISVPDFKNLGKIAVNKAELVITIADDPFGSDSIYTAPQQMYTLRSDSLGQNNFIIDLFDGLAYYGGSRVNGQYKFNLAKHFQLISDGILEDNGLVLITFPSSKIADRVILGNESHSKAMKLNLTYTKVN